MNSQARRVADRPRVRVVIFVLLFLLPVAFIGGRVTAPLRVTIRQAEAAPAPVPRDLPIGMERFHDAVAGVTCWRARNGYDVVGVSCLPDAALEATWVTGREP